MSRGSNVGRTVFGVAAAAGVAGLLNYTPPPTEVRAAAPVPSRPVVAGPFTATPASIPLPVEVTTPTTTLPPPAPTTTAAPPVTQAPPPPVPEPAPPEPPEVVWGPAPAPVARYAPAPVYYPPEPEPEAAPADDSDDKCAHFDELLSALNDSDLRAAVATVGCG